MQALHDKPLVRATSHEGVRIEYSCFSNVAAIRARLTNPAFQEFALPEK
jgi:hypothetical protein